MNIDNCIKMRAIILLISCIFVMGCLTSEQYEIFRQQTPQKSISYTNTHRCKCHGTFYKENHGKGHSRYCMYTHESYLPNTYSKKRHEEKSKVNDNIEEGYHTGLHYCQDHGEDYEQFHPVTGQEHIKYCIFSHSDKGMKRHLATWNHMQNNHYCECHGDEYLKYHSLQNKEHNRFCIYTFK